jgi:hypothetical protein
MGAAGSTVQSTLSATPTTMSGLLPTGQPTTVVGPTKEELQELNDASDKLDDIDILIPQILLEFHNLFYDIESIFIFGPIYKSLKEIRQQKDNNPLWVEFNRRIDILDKIQFFDTGVYSDSLEESNNLRKQLIKEKYWYAPGLEQQSSYYIKLSPRYELPGTPEELSEIKKKFIEEQNQQIPEIKQSMRNERYNQIYKLESGGHAINVARERIIRRNNFMIQFTNIEAEHRNKYHKLHQEYLGDERYHNRTGKEDEIYAIYGRKINEIRNKNYNIARFTEPTESEKQEKQQLTELQHQLEAERDAKIDEWRNDVREWSIQYERRKQNLMLVTPERLEQLREARIRFEEEKRRIAEYNRRYKRRQERTKQLEIAENTQQNDDIWDGYKKSEIMVLNAALSPEGGISVDYYWCPFCLEIGSRSEACLFMTHYCKNPHPELFKKYNREGKQIQFCVNCNGPTHEHNHYPFADINEPRPDLMVNPREFSLFRGDCGTFVPTGGNLGKMRRFYGIIKEACELEKEVGKISVNDARMRIIESMWKSGGDTTLTKENMTTGDKFNLPCEFLKKEGASPIQNIPYPEEQANRPPVRIAEGECYMCYSEAPGEIDYLWKFNHIQPDGSQYEHKLICTDCIRKQSETVEIQHQSIGQADGRCIDPDCKGTLYPEELDYMLTEEEVDKYQDRFRQNYTPHDKRLGGGLFGSLDSDNDFKCSLPRKKTTGGRKKRTQKKKKSSHRL